MLIEEIYATVEGNIGKLCEITLNDGSKTGKVILHGTTGDTTSSPAQLFLIISEGKSEKQISFYEIESIDFYCN